MRFIRLPAALPADFDDDAGGHARRLPLIFGDGMGSELRAPLGIAIVGGLVVSQVLTLFTTPVIYLAFGNLARRLARTHGMNIPAIFIRRPVATILLTIGIALSGMLAFSRMPVAPLPQIAFPTIQVSASMAGASPETMASTVAEPLERHLGAIADVTEMTSQSGLGTTRIVLQFGLNRDINGAARDVEAAIQAARADLPTTLRANPTYNEVQSGGRADHGAGAHLGHDDARPALSIPRTDAAGAEILAG